MEPRSAPGSPNFRNLAGRWEKRAGAPVSGSANKGPFTQSEEASKVTVKRSMNMRGWAPQLDIIVLMRPQALARVKGARSRRNNPLESQTAASTLRRDGRFLMGLDRLEPEVHYRPHAFQAVFLSSLLTEGLHRVYPGSPEGRWERGEGSDCQKNEGDPGENQGIPPRHIE